MAGLTCFLGRPFLAVAGVTVQAFIATIVANAWLSFRGIYLGHSKVAVATVGVGARLESAHRNAHVGRT